MTMRNFRQHAQGYGDSDCRVIVSLDDNIIYQGSVSTVTEPRPTMPNWQFDIRNYAWSWQESMDFQGTRQLSISVSGAPLMLGQTLAEDANLDFVSFYSVTIDGISYPDPFSDVVIDGVPQIRGSLDLIGQYWWWIPAGSTLTATMHVNPPEVPYLVFNSVPENITAGTQAQFSVSISEVHPSYPLPQIYSWQIVNDTTTNADFINTSGNITFNTVNSSFAINIVNHETPQGNKNFRVEIVEPTSGNIMLTSRAMTIVA